MGPSDLQSADDARIRDHLANERTYLAWTRTGIAALGLGVVIAKLRYLFPAGAAPAPSSGLIRASNIGLLLALIGLMTIAGSAWRFRQVRDQIREQKYRSSDLLVLAMTATLLVFGLMVVWYLMHNQPVASPRALDGVARSLDSGGVASDNGP